MVIPKSCIYRYVCSSVLMTDVPKDKQSPEPLLHLFQDMNAVEKEADASPLYNENLQLLNLPLPIIHQQICPKICIFNPRIQSPDLISCGMLAMQNIIRKQSLAMCQLGLWCLLKDHTGGKMSNTRGIQVQGECPSLQPFKTMKLNFWQPLIS